MNWIVNGCVSGLSNHAVVLNLFYGMETKVLDSQIENFYFPSMLYGS